MHIPEYLPQIQYGYDNGLTTITFGLIGSAVCLFVLLISYFELKYKKQKQ